MPTIKGIKKKKKEERHASPTGLEEHIANSDKNLAQRFKEMSHNDSLYKNNYEQSMIETIDFKSMSINPKWVILAIDQTYCSGIETNEIIIYAAKKQDELTI